MTVKLLGELHREEGSLPKAISLSDRVLDPCVDSVCRDVKDMTTKPGVLHREDASLPGTASLSVSSDSERSDPNENGSDREHDRCPVTGQLSNVLDDYVVFPKLLGEGCYGCVRECVNRSTWQAFACKSIKKSMHRSLEHLQNEVWLLSELNHKGVMRMVDCYEDADYVHIVSEKYTGGELFNVIVGNKNENGCLSEHKAACITKSLLEAVAYLHENDVVHRDIKPENILFQSQEEKILKVIDFGLSRRHVQGEACISNPVGTSYYMSPEVLEGKYDKPCDLWSVGVIVYMLLCGYPPFNGNTDQDIFDAIARGRLQFPARQWDSRSDDAKRFTRCLLRRDPRRRMTAKEALLHPWMRSLGQKRERRQVAKMPSRLRYLRIP